MERQEKQVNDKHLYEEVKRLRKENARLTVAPNQLNREFTVQTPNTISVGDITYLPTGEGWLYLAVVLDLCSRAVVGWFMREILRTQHASIVLAAVSNA